MSDFYQTIRWKQVDSFLFEGVINEDWMQGRSAFGGVGVGAALHAVKSQCVDTHRVLSLQSSFLSPLKMGATQLELKILRRGRNITFWNALITQNEHLAIMMMLTTGQSRSTQIPPTPTPKLNLKPIEQLTALPFIQGTTPNFTQHFEYRWGPENLPFSQAKEAKVSGWIRPKGILKNPSEPEIAAMMDAWPPPILMKADRPLPASTIQWQIHFTHPPTESSWWGFQSKSSCSADGLSHDHQFLWDEHGTLLAFSQQLTAEFSSR